MAEQLTEQIVSPELAFELKQKGFDSVCIAYRWDKTWEHFKVINAERLTYAPLSHINHNRQKIDNPKGAEINKLTAKQKAIEHALTLI